MVIVSFTNSCAQTAQFIVKKNLIRSVLKTNMELIINEIVTPEIVHKKRRAV